MLVAQIWRDGEHEGWIPRVWEGLGQDLLGDWIWVVSRRGSKSLVWELGGDGGILRGGTEEQTGDGVSSASGPPFPRGAELLLTGCPVASRS